jgi:S1-C subfamily serine protease
MSKQFEYFLKILFIFFVGALGGIFGSEVVFLKSKSNFYSPPTIRLETKEVKIQENTALKDAIEKTQNSIVAIQIQTKKGKIINGSGIILTTDGIVLTLSELLPQGETINFFVDGEKVSYQILKRDPKLNLGVVKVEKKNLTPVPFSDFETLKIGERVFALSSFFNQGKIQKAVNEGIVRYFDEEKIETNIIEDSNFLGSALFDIEGKLLGINYLDPKQKILSIPITKIRQFTGF